MPTFQKLIRVGIQFTVGIQSAVLHAAVFFQNGGGVVKIVGGGGVIGVRSRDFAD